MTCGFSLIIIIINLEMLMRWEKKTNNQKILHQSVIHKIYKRRFVIVMVIVLRAYGYCYLPRSTAHYGMYSWMRWYCICCLIGCRHFYSVIRLNTVVGNIVAWPAMPSYNISVEHQRKSCRHYFASTNTFDRICWHRFQFHWFGCHCSDCIWVVMAVVAHI